MKKWIIAVLLMVAPWLRAQNTTLTGTIAGPSGTGLNGVLQLQLVMPGAATIVAGCGGPLYILPQQISINVSNGNLVSPPNVWGADCLSPALIPYHVILRDTNGNQIVNDYWMIQGSTFNVGTAASAAPSGSNIVFTFPMTRLSYFSSLATACSTVASVGGTLYVDEAISPPAGFTCAANVWVAQGGVITLSGTANVFSSPFIYAPFGKWLVGSSSNAAAFTSLKSIPAEWYGADSTGTLDSTVAIEAAVESALLSSVAGTPSAGGSVPNVSLNAGNFNIGTPGGSALGTIILGALPAGAGLKGIRLIGAGINKTTVNWTGPATQPALAVTGFYGGVQGLTLTDAGTGWTAGIIQIENSGTFNGQTWPSSSDAQYTDLAIQCQFQPGNGFVIGGIGELSGQADQNAFTNIDVRNCGYGAAYVVAGNNTLGNMFYNNAPARNFYGLIDYNGNVGVKGKEWDHVGINFVAQAGAVMDIADVRGEEVVKWVGGGSNGAGSSVTLNSMNLNAHFVTSPIGTVSISKAGGSTTITPAYNLPIVCTGTGSSLSCNPTGISEPTNQLITFTSPQCFTSSTQGPAVGPATYVISDVSTAYLVKTKITSPFMDQSCLVAFGNTPFTETSSGDTMIEWGNATATTTGCPSSCSTTVTFSAPAFVNGDSINIAGATSAPVTLSGCVPVSGTSETCTASAAPTANVSGAVVTPGTQEVFHVTLDWPSSGGTYSLANSIMPDHTAGQSFVVGNTTGRATWQNNWWAANIVDPTNHTVFTCNGNIHANLYNGNAGVLKMPDCPGDNVAAFPLANGTSAVTQTSTDASTAVATDQFVQNIASNPPLSPYGGFGAFLNGALSSNNLGNGTYWVAIPGHPTPTITANNATDCYGYSSTMTKIVLGTITGTDYSGINQTIALNSGLASTYAASTVGNTVGFCAKGGSGGETLSVAITTTLISPECFGWATITLTTSPKFYTFPSCAPGTVGSTGTYLAIYGQGVANSGATVWVGDYFYQPGATIPELAPITTTTAFSGIGEVAVGLPVWLSFSSSTIPACTSSFKGAKEFVTDGSSTPTLWATYSGGGSTFGPVHCDGSNWRYF